MRFKLIAALAFAMSVTIFAGTGAAQGPAQNPPPPPPQSGQGQQNPGGMTGPGRPMRQGLVVNPGMMPPDMMGMMGRAWTRRGDRPRSGWTAPERFQATGVAGRPAHENRSRAFGSAG
jgi:hypothetical protein